MSNADVQNLVNLRINKFPRIFTQIFIFIICKRNLLFFFVNKRPQKQIHLRKSQSNYKLTHVQRIKQRSIAQFKANGLQSKYTLMHECANEFAKHHLPPKITFFYLWHFPTLTLSFYPRLIHRQQIKLLFIAFHFLSNSV